MTEGRAAALGPDAEEGHGRRIPRRGALDSCISAALVFAIRDHGRKRLASDLIRGGEFARVGGDGRGEGTTRTCIDVGIGGRKEGAGGNEGWFVPAGSRFFCGLKHGLGLGVPRVQFSDGKAKMKGERYRMPTKGIENNEVDCR